MKVCARGYDEQVMSAQISNKGAVAPVQLLATALQSIPGFYYSVFGTLTI
jgi:hypothetical protein